MPPEIKVIQLAMPFRMGQVSCYLMPASAGYVLIDTGNSSARPQLVRELEAAGCTAGHLQLIVLTHGDFDHTGNAAYLRQALGGKIGMHADDVAMAERGDMFAGRKRPNLLIRKLLPALSGFGAAERFTPDLLLADGDDLAAYGLEARIVAIPGHSRGSIAVLTAGGDLFCGDLLANTDRPALNSLMDDPAAGQASLLRLRGLAIRTVYPGHGQAFSLEQLGG